LERYFETQQAQQAQYQGALLHPYRSGLTIGL